MGLFDLFKREPEEYSNKWIQGLTDDEWEEEREKVRLRHCSGDEKAQGILYRFDDEWCRRKDDGTPWTPPAHREHGWYLSNDDD